MNKNVNEGEKMKQKSYVMIKPEFANQPLVIAEVEKRIEAMGLKIIKKCFVRYDKESAAAHYAEHVGKEMYPNLERYITSDRALGMIVEGEDAIKKIRAIVGSTMNPAEGTIRYDIPIMLGIERRITENVVHASDSPESAEREIEIFEKSL